MTATADDAGPSLTEGALFVPLVALSAPLVATQLMQVLYNLVDTFWVGRIGADAVSAISFAWPVIFLIISVGGGLTLAGTVLVAQHAGAGNDEDVTEVAGQTLSFVVLVSIAAGLLGYLATPTVLDLVGTTPGTDVHRMAVAYTRTMFLGLGFTFGFFVFQALLRGWGDTKTPMYLMAVSIALNVVADPVFILGFHENPVFAWLGLESLEATLYAATGFDGWGVLGAAVATAGARAVGAVVGVGMLFSGSVGIRLSLSDLRVEFATVRKLVRIGAPTSLEQSSGALSDMAMTALVALVSTQAVGALGVGNRLTTLVWLPAIGLAMGVETVVGQNVGADEPRRAKRAVLLACGLVTGVFAVVSVLAYVYAEPFVGAFVSGDGPEATAVVSMGVDYVRVVAPTYAFVGVFHVVNGAFHGAGSTRLSMVLSFVGLWAFRAVVTTALVVGLGTGAIGAWWAMGLSHVSAAALVGVFFFRGRWTDSVVERDDEDVAATPAD